MLKSIDPATGRELATFPEADESAIEAAIARAYEVRHGWRDAGIEHRSRLLRSVAGVLRADKARYASILTSEMGKPIVEAEGEIEKCAWTAGWIADNAARLLADETIESTATRSYVRYQPLGVVLAVMPWNFPFWQAFRAGLPALAASATEPPRPGAEPFDADRWNRSQVRKRAGTDSQELLNEFDQGTTRLVDALTDAPLDKPVTIGAFPGYSLGDAMAEMLEHQRRHLDDLRAALHANPES